MENCSIQITKSKVGIELSKILGTDDLLKLTMFLEVTSNDNFTSEFIEWYKTANKTDEAPSLDVSNTSTAAKIARNIVKFYYNNHFSVSATVRTDIVTESVVRTYGYSNTFEREQGKQHVGNIIFDIFNNINKNGLEIKSNKYKYYLNEVKNTWRDYIYNYIGKLTNKSRDYIISKYEEAADKTSYIDKALGGKLKDATAAQLFAVYKELNGTSEHALEYIKEVFTNNKLNEIRHTIERDIDSEQQRIAIEEAKNENSENTIEAEEDAQQDSEPDTYIARTDHSGIYSSFMTHIGTRLRNYFNSLKVLATPNIGDYDTNNTYGLPTTMDANSCSSMIYNHGDFHNVPMFIKRIEQIGKTIAGFEAFVQLAADLKANPDLANEMFTVFAKTKIAKIETVLEDGKVVVRRSNNMSDKKYVFITDLYNDLKTSIEDQNDTILRSKALQADIKVNTVIQKIKNSKDLERPLEDRKAFEQEAKQELGICKEAVVNLIKSVYPSIQEGAIISYIEMAKNADGDIELQLRNISDLISDIKNAINAMNDSLIALNQIKARAAEIKEHNNQLREQEANGKWVDSSEYLSLNDVYSDDYIQPQKPSVNSIASKLISFSVIKTDNNSRNIYGNNNSDIINSSHITNLKNMLEDIYIDENGRTRNKSLEAWGAELFKSTQYNYSTLLLEQVDEDTKEVLNPGTAVFRYSNGQLCLTENGTNILRFALFSGSGNIDSGTNADYASMSEGDYLPTSYYNFFKTVDSNNTGLKLATYFLRTPSDAPKNFVLIAPRFNTFDLFIPANVSRFNSDLEDIVNLAAKPITVKEYNDKYRNKDAEGNNLLYNYAIEIQEDDIAKYLIPNNHIKLPYDSAARAIPGTYNAETGSYEAYVSFSTSSGKIIVLQGTINKAGKGRALDNAVVAATLTTDNRTNRNIDSAFSDILYSYYHDMLLEQDVTIGDVTYKKAEYTVNTKSKVFKLLRNQFKQELLDAAVALNCYFKTIEVADGEFEIEFDKDGLPVLKEGASLDEGFENYHKGADGTVYTKTENGIEFSGNVFHSSKFTLVQNIDGKVEKINYLDRIIAHNTKAKDNKLINFLYGGAMRLKLDSKGEVKDIILSNDQLDTVDKALSEYITDAVNQGIDRVNVYSDFITDEPIDRNHITEYFINNLLIHFTYDEILEGNSKFYKSPQDLLKRAKEGQGSGTPSGIANYEAGFTPSLETVKEYSYLNNGKTTVNVKEEYTDVKGNVRTRNARNEDGTLKKEEISIQKLFSDAGFPVQQRYGFKGVTVFNTVSTNHKALQEIKEQLVKQGLSNEDALDILYGPIQYEKDGVTPKINKETGEVVRKGGFTDTKVNDAQSYITFEEWIRRIGSRGQLERYMPLIKKLLDPNPKLTAAELKEFMQVQKNFYYDLYYDSKFKVRAPRQIKNAEFVLHPKLIEGTQLEKVYWAMRKAGIDQLNTKETSKASNSEILRLWDNNGDLTQETIDTFADRAAVVGQIFSYNNLYTQQETPQHMNSQNKAGIQIVKKLLDNIPDDPNTKLGKLKERFFELFATNISEACNELLRKFEVPVDEYGNIDIDEHGNIKGINNKAFYEKLKEELLRIGADNNAMDYVTIQQGNSTPNMPSYRNNIGIKFESIVNSIFNNSITRQKLPGFHAAQVTNVGFRAMGDSIKHVSYSQDLEYHRNGEPYIQVMVPASFLGIDKNSPHYRGKTDAEILAELAVDNLDTVIGYRIPTEGKQSVCVMKVVGFLSDGYGSTIVVPNDWVAQTGSDFDIDSVYAIQYETYKTKTGQVKKYKYKNKVDKYDWFSYIIEAFNVYDDETISAELAKAKETIKQMLHAKRREFDTEHSEIFNSFTEQQQNIIKKIQADITDLLETQGYYDIDINTNDKTVARYKELVKRLNVLYNKNLSTHPKFTKKVLALIQNIENTLAFIDGRSEEYTEEVRNKLDEIINNNLSRINKAVTDAGLMTLSEFIDPKNIHRANGLKRRNSEIAKIMMEILQDPACLEENVSRSNSDHISYNKNVLSNDNVKAAREGRSPYNVFDQMDYMEEAVAGMKLKAFSVTLDTFCSVCNKVKPELTRPIYVIYDAKDFKDAEEASSRFDGSSVKDGKFSVRHKTYGWSKDYRNIEGKYITTYSSETTAYILDNIKEGAIPNVNDYTFATFKTLVNAGTDFRTAMSFIMQPGIREIVNAYNTKKSVFASNTDNPIHTAIANIAEKLGVDVIDEKVTYKKTYKPVVAILATLNSLYKDKFNAIFNIEGNKDIAISFNEDHLSNIPLIVPKLVDRLNRFNPYDISSPVEESDLLFDLGTILAFKYINDTASAIGDYARCCNPDRFGAKQSVFATRQIFKALRDLMYTTETVTESDEYGNEVETFTSKEIPATLKVGDKHILASIYPGIDNPNFNDIDLLKHILQYKNVMDSSYPSLFAFLKYASATSVAIARTLFDTQDDNFVGLIEGITDVFSGYKPVLTEDIYNDFRKYVISSLDTDCPAIKYPIKVRPTKTGVSIDYNTEFDATNPDNDNILITQEERNRIYGYNKDVSIVNREITFSKYTDKDGTVRTRRKVNIIPFTVKNASAPTDEEMIQFEKLSPAQKIYWIQQNSTDTGIFGYIKTNLKNPAARGKKMGMQTLEFIEQNIDSNVLYAEFNKAFYNTNPLIVSAAIDLVKYAIQVEGMKISARAINKVIANNCLYTEFGINGLGIIPFAKDSMEEIKGRKGKWLDDATKLRLYENYLRSHPELNVIKKVYLNKTNKTKFNLNKQAYGMYILEKPNDSEDDSKNVQNFNNLLKSMGVKYHLPLTNTYKTNSYIRLIENKKSTLYKINDFGDTVILYPLSNLEENENAVWSVNEDNNQNSILSSDAYEAIMRAYIADKENNKFTYQWVSAKLKDLKADAKASNFWYKPRRAQYGDMKAREFDINTLAETSNSFAIFIDKIKDHFAKNTNQRFFAAVHGISDYIFSPGVEFGTTQTIHTEKGDRKFNIFIPSDIAKYERAFLKNKYNTDDIANPTFRQIAKNAQDAKQQHFTNVVEVVPYVDPNDEAMAASFEEPTSRVIDFAISRASARNIYDTVLDPDFNINANNVKPTANNENIFLQTLRDKGISVDINSLRENRGEALRALAKFATTQADYISHDLFDRFVLDADAVEGWLSITHPEVQAMISKNAKLMDRYQQAINEALAFVQQFKAFDDVTIEDGDTQDKLMLNKIKDALSKVRKLPTNDLTRKACETIANTQSTNPLIKDRLIDVFDGYWKSYGGMWWFHDIMENGTPMLQIILKNVMSDLEAKRMMGIKAKKEYWNKINDIKKRAAAAGVTVNLNNFINEDGRFIEAYSYDFVDKLDNLIKTMQTAIESDGKGSIAHLKARLELEEFKAKHVNQEAKPEYYIGRCQTERYMLDNYPELYSAYMKLHFAQQELYQSIDKDGITDDIRKQLTEIRAKMRNLYHPMSYLENIDVPTSLKFRPEFYEEAVYTEDELKYLNFYSTQAAEALETALNTFKALNDKYFGYDSVFGFDEQVKIYQNIVLSFEKPDRNGIPTVPLELLEQNEQYVEARNWLIANAKWEFELNIDANNQRTGLGAKLERAFQILGFNRRGKNDNIENVYKTVETETGSSIRDTKGVIDGRKLAGRTIASPFGGPTRSLYEDIKHSQQLAYYGEGVMEDLDLRLLSNATPHKEVFNRAFYAKITGNGKINVEYLQTVTKLNKILEKYLGPDDGIIHLEEIPNTPEGIAELNKIAELYQKLRTTEKKTGTTNGADVASFIDQYTETVVNKELFRAQYSKALEYGGDYKDAFDKIAFERDAEGNISVWNNELQPNKFLYTYIKPVGEEGDPIYDKYASQEEQEAINIINQVYKNVPTKYYFMALREAMHKANTDRTFDYQAWYDENHIYNPYTRKKEPIACWVTRQVRTELFLDGTIQGGKYVPRNSQRQRKVNDGNRKVGNRTIYHPEEDMRNHEYKPKADLYGNYIKGSEGGIYDTNVSLNEYEKEMMNFFKETLAKTATTEKSRRYFDKGYLPLAKKVEKTTIKTVGKEALKMVGIGIARANKDNDWYKEIGYAFDRTPDMPLTKILDSKQTIDLKTKYKQLEDNPIDRDACTSDEDYNNKVREREELMNNYKEQIRKERQSLINRDWYNVIDCYLEQAAHYNAVLDNKNRLYFLHNVLKDMKMYSRKHGLSGSLAKNLRRDPEGNIYDTSVDEHLIDQYETYLRRLLFDQWKENEGKLTTFANNLQGFTSANYMMLNVRGGIANVTLGETSILAEAAAKEYFGAKDWGFGTAEWTKGVIGYCRSGYHMMFNQNDIAFNKQDAIIKFMNIVNYDEHTGVVRELTLEEYSRKIRDLMFSPQTIGEHFMQNSVMFAMMNSHKIIRLNDGTYTYMTENDYIRYKQGELLESEILSDEQIRKFAEFKESLRKDKDKLADYAWYRKDVLSQFLTWHCTDEQIEDFKKKRKEQEKRLKEEFRNEKETIYSQLELGSDGHMVFKDGSLLAQLDTLMSDNVGEVTQAIELLSKFGEKCKKVNKKIHGVYDNLGSAWIEQKWYGSLVMQYHKHLPMGILKRYMARGHWDETRESVEKGMVQTIYDVANLNLQRVKMKAGLTDTELGALEGFVFLITHLHNYVAQLSTTLSIIPSYEKANLYRNIGDAAGVAAGVLTTALLWYISTDDDEMQDSIWFNMTLYEADRLATEAFLYNPWGLTNEGKKLMSTPIAAQSIITDITSSLINIRDFMFDEDYDGYYHTGRFAGQPRLWVYVQRRLPIWNGIRGVLDAPVNNHYYKIAYNPIIGFNALSKKNIQGTED